MHRSSGVQIEVLDEEEYELEVQRELEEQSAKRLAEIERTKSAASTATGSVPSSPHTQTQAKISQAGTPDTDASTDWWSVSLAALDLPTFFHSLHDTRVYDPPAYRTIVSHDVPAFHRRALAALRSLADGVRSHTNAPRASATVQLILSAMRFLIPQPPSIPTLPNQIVEDAQEPFELVWQTPELSIAAAQLLQELGAKDGQTTVDTPSSTSSASAIRSTRTVDAANILTSTTVQALLARHCGVILSHLRQSMRSGGGTDQAHADWKGADRFPSPFVVSAVLAHTPPSALAGEMASVFPLVMPLVTDHEPRFKIAGLVAVTRLLQCVPPSAWTPGSGAVMLDSLKTCLSFRTRSILALAVPAFVQGHVTFFPAVHVNQDGVMEKVRAGMIDGTASNTSSVFTLTDPSLLDRVRVHGTLMQTILHEAVFFTLSSSAENSFALFIYAQSMLPLLLYVGPLAILPNLTQLLGLLTAWATLADSSHVRTNLYAWQCLECLLCMRVVEGRVVGHAGQLIEIAAEAWITGVESTPTEQKSSSSLSINTSLTQERHPSATAIISTMKRLRLLQPHKFDLIWNEVAKIAELASLDRALKQDY